VSEILYEVQITGEEKRDPVLGNLLTVAWSIFLACSQCQAELQRYRYAYQAAELRHRQLQQQLYTVLDLIAARATTQADKERGSPIQRLVVAGAEEFKLSTEPRLVHPSKLAGRSASVPPASEGKREEPGAPSLAVCFLGQFRVYQDDQPVKNWPSGKGKAVFKYLITQRDRAVPKEVLMELFWPDYHPDAARNNLNVAIYGLRQALRNARPSFSHILFQDDSYLPNPELEIWVDFEAFMEHYSTAQALERQRDLVGAIREYRAAEALYQGEFLEEDRYESWLTSLRQNLQDDYLSLLDRLGRFYLEHEDYAACTAVCNKMLAIDDCIEEAHRRLMRCYSEQNQRFLALRQYHLCVEALATVLDVSPSPTTTELYEQIRQDRSISMKNPPESS
jgi:DNA-binding SARP family transcriptional activator